MLEGKVKVWNTEMSTNVKRATRKGLSPAYYSILAIIFNIIHVFFSKTFLVLFCFPSNMAAKYAVRHVWRHAKVVYTSWLSMMDAGQKCMTFSLLYWKFKDNNVINEFEP